MIKITEESYSELSENYGGFCTNCGAEADGCEPDAERYTCESCGARSVYGAEQLLIIGVLVFVDSDDE